MWSIYIEPVWTNRGACKREELNPSTWISKTELHESLYGPETYNEYENCGQVWGNSIPGIPNIPTYTQIGRYGFEPSNLKLARKTIN